MPERPELARLEADGLLRREAEGLRATRRWHGAVARAALRLERGAAPAHDVRLPIAAALLDLYPDLADEDLVGYVAALLPIVGPELERALGTGPAAAR